MITLHGFGTAFGLPDPSPFVIKTELHLRMAGLEYRKMRADPRKGPRGKIPWMDDAGVIVPDSTLIRKHIETTHGFDFDTSLSPEQKGVAWSVEKMMEDHLYWLIVIERWLDPANFEKGPRVFFDKVPALLRPIVLAMVGRQVRRTLHGHGIGRYTSDELGMLGREAATAIARVLGDKPWMMGQEPCGLDATALAFIASAACPHFNGPLRASFDAQPNLGAYVQRGMARWCPEFATAS